METYQFTGIHFLASYCGCDVAQLDNLEGLKNAMNDAVKASGATILGHSDHVFQPTGYTCVFVLSESHASIHTYPEMGACFVDLFTCGDHCLYGPFNQVLKAYLQPSGVSFQVVKRENDMKMIEYRNTGYT